MAQKRSDVVSQEETGIYHCTGNCVRGAFLCGADERTGKDYEHRRGWIESRIRFLSEFFSVEVLSFSVMSSHYHVVPIVHPQAVQDWSDEEVARRWCSVYGGGRKGGESAAARQKRIDTMLRNEQKVKRCRRRLGDLSWFMSALAENIARRANREDQCKGRFWDGRFGCKRLMDEAAVLACMSYVDLNPVRARIAEVLEESAHTGAHERIHALRAKERLGALSSEEIQSAAQQSLIRAEQAEATRADWLVDLDSPQSPLPGITTLDYLNLVEETGKIIREDKPGHLPEDLAPLVERLGLDAAAWAANVRDYDSLFHRIAGRVEHLVDHAASRGRHWFCGRKGSRRLYKTQQPTS